MADKNSTNYAKLRETMDIDQALAAIRAEKARRLSLTAKGFVELQAHGLSVDDIRSLGVTGRTITLLQRWAALGGGLKPENPVQRQIQAPPGEATYWAGAFDEVGTLEVNPLETTIKVVAKYKPASAGRASAFYIRYGGDQRVMVNGATHLVCLTEQDPGMLRLIIDLAEFSYVWSDTAAKLRTWLEQQFYYREAEAEVRKLFAKQ